MSPMVLAKQWTHLDIPGCRFTISPGAGNMDTWSDWLYSDNVNLNPCLIFEQALSKNVPFLARSKFCVRFEFWQNYFEIGWIKIARYHMDNLGVFVCCLPMALCKYLKAISTFVSGGT